MALHLWFDTDLSVSDLEKKLKNLKNKWPEIFDLQWLLEGAYVKDEELRKEILEEENFDSKSSFMMKMRKSAEIGPEEIVELIKKEFTYHKILIKFD